MILSIVMPAHNSSGHMAPTLKSVASLLGEDAELIFVDDGSSDNTADQFFTLQRSIPLANSKIVRQSHQGVSAARNRGIEHARGDYLLFLDSDDCVSHELLALLRASVSDYAADVVCWGWDTESADGSVLRRYFDVHPQLPLNMTGEEALYRRVVDRSLRVWTASAAYKRTHVAEHALAYTRNCSVGEDLEFSYLALLYAKKVSFLPRVLATYRKRSGSVTSKPRLSRFDSILALKRVQAALDADGRPSVRAVASHFRRTKILVNYFYTLESYLMNPTAGSLSETLAALNEVFPELTSEIQEAISGDRLGLPKEWRLFAVSPMAWWAWVRVRRRTDRYLPTRFRSSGPLAQMRRAELLAR